MATLKPKSKRHILWFDEISKDDGDYVGGKNANLGEMYTRLASQDVPVPNGFAITAEAYRQFINETRIAPKIQAALKKLKAEDIKNLQKTGRKIRSLIERARLPKKLRENILAAYRSLSEKYDMKEADVAVRSSATAEDLPSISKDEHVLVTIDGKPVYQPIEEIYEIVGDGANHEIKVPAMQDYRVKWLDVRKVYKHKAEGKDKLYKITTSTGREITVSPNHTLIVLDEDELEAKEVSSIHELKGNEKIPVINELSPLGRNDAFINVLDYVSGGDVVIHKDKIKIRNNSNNWKTQNGLQRKIKVNKDFAYFLGLYCAEGSTYSSNCVTITNSEPAIMTKATTFLSSLGLYNGQKINKHSVRVYCKALVRFLHSISGKPSPNTKGKGKLCSHKKVPNFIFGWNKELIGEFLKGYFDGDGGTEKDTVTCCSTSKMLISGIIKLLEMLGIEWHLRHREHSLRKAHVVSIPLREVNKFAEFVGFESPKKRRHLVNLVRKRNNREFVGEFKNSLEINKSLSKKFRRLVESNLGEQVIEANLCPMCKEEVPKSSSYKGRTRFYCADCNKTFYESDMEKAEIEKYVHHDDKGRFKAGAAPWNKGYKSGTYSQARLKQVLASEGLDTEFPSLNNSIIWDQIEKIKPIEYDDSVYDFCVPGVENFASGVGGIITHNSASFAGQQETYLNVNSERNLITSVRKCFASLFTDRAISYREDKGFKHDEVYISVAVQKMVRSDKASSGVVFSIDTESGFEDVVFINASYGLGEYIVQGTVTPDQFYVHKPTLKKGHKSIISRTLGGKRKKLVYSSHGTRKGSVPDAKRNQYSISGDEVLQLAKYACTIEEHYGMPMDIEWAKDGREDKLYILQARPETVHAVKEKNMYKTYKLKKKGKLLTAGLAVGEKIGRGKANLIDSPEGIHDFEEGQVLVTNMTDPDWEPIMKIASAIVTNAGGRTCHSAIVSRELGIPCVVGTGDATKKIKQGRGITVSCAEGDEGKIYEGLLEFEVNEVNVKKVPKTKTEVMMNVGLPDSAFKLGQLPSDGVGLAREEFIISEDIGIHPLALLNYEKIKNTKRDPVTQKELKQIDQLTKRYAAKDKPQYFVDKLAEGIAKIAAGFYPRPAILRCSDFKSNEYKNLLGGKLFEPEEENPMIGWRGASRYYSKKYQPAFELECQAIRKVREEFGLMNVKIMIPFCRTVDEAKKVLKVMKHAGLESGKDDLEIYMMVEIPADVILLEDFAKLFDGFSIGSNDLTQLTLGLDRDSELVSEVFDERDPAVLELVASAIRAAKKANKKIGICGDAPSTHIDFTQFLLDKNIDSVSISPDVYLKTKVKIAELEKNQEKD